MKQPVYIISACSISPQYTYLEEQFLSPVVSNNTGALYVADPDYTRYISPVAIRRMSRMLKRGITAGMRCLEEAGVKTPDAIIIGTARGSVTDMENFLHDMIDMKEEALNPTAFIQSTYNSVNGWLAMITKSTCYNQTFVHRGFSMELPLFDAQLFLSESPDTRYLLVGGIEEMTPEYFSIRNKIDYYKEAIPDSVALLQHSDTLGSIGGEGTHFFTISNRADGAVCTLCSLQLLQKPNVEELQTAIAIMLADNQLAIGDIDVLISGMNGDSRTQSLMEPVANSCTPNTNIVTFKHLCGEYDTASGFGLWLACYMFRHGQIPAAALYRKGDTTSVKTILICNVTIGANVSLMLLSKP